MMKKLQRPEKKDNEHIESGGVWVYLFRGYVPM
jgi:hypothetical protein